MKIIRHHFETIGSTNTWAKEHVDEFEKNALTLITADEQVSGRGRFKRVWHSPSGVNIYATFCFFVDSKREDIGHIPQLLALSAAQALETLQFKPTLKWPNDILLSGKKVAGILCETVVNGSNRCVVCGIGLNVNMSSEELSKIDRPATSLLIESQVQYSVKAILELIIGKFSENLEMFFQKNFQVFFDGYQKRSCFKKGDRVRFHNNQEIVEGFFHQLNKDGTVTLFFDNSSLKTYYGGEFV